jgi:outer membrane protein
VKINFALNKNYYNMKTTICTILLAFATVFTMSAQDTNDSDGDSGKWKMRFRILSVIPSADIDVDTDIDISTAFTPELDFTYFFNENLAAELILGTAKHKVEVTGADLGHVWLLPPTLNLQYHFTGGTVTPYLGAGVNYTIFYGVDSGDVDDLDYDSSFGLSFQGGLDYDLNDKWFLNLDIKKILLKTDVSLDGGDAVEVTIDPLIIGLGAGFKF